MLTGKIRNDIDKLWEKFWTGGITNPLTVIEQISYLMFARMLDMQEDVAERKANLSRWRGTYAHRITGSFAGRQPALG